MRYEGLDQTLIGHVERRDLGWTDEQLGDPFVLDPSRAVASGPPPKQVPEWAMASAGYGAPQHPGQYPAQQYPAQQYPAQQYAAQQYPAQQYPAQQYPAQQYPAQQYPAQQYPAQQYPAQPPAYAQPPAPTPPPAYAPPPAAPAAPAPSSSDDAWTAPGAGGGEGTA